MEVVWRGDLKAGKSRVREEGGRSGTWQHGSFLCCDELLQLCPLTKTKIFLVLKNQLSLESLPNDGGPGLSGPVPIV